MCPRISVPTSSSPLPLIPCSPSLSHLRRISLSLSLCRPPSLRCMYARVYVYIHTYIYKKREGKNSTSAVYARGGELPSCTDTLLLALLLLLRSPSSLLRFARTVISYLYLSPPTTYTPPSSRRTTGIISVFPQTRLTRNVVQQALRAHSTGRDILHLRPAAPLSLSLPSAFDSTPSIDNSRLILRESADFSRSQPPGLLRVHGEFRGSR